MTARSLFDGQLNRLFADLLEMSQYVEDAIEGACRAVTTGDISRAEFIVKSDALVNDAEREIEALCLKMLVSQQPVAGDLRNISAALKIITDLERIGDQAADICDIAISMPQGHTFKEIAHLPQMAATTASMVRSSINAMVERDLDKVHAAMEADAEVDGYFVEVRNEIISLIRAEEADAEVALDYLMVAKYLERIGDHAENIAEWAEYSINGMHKGTLIAVSEE